MRKLSLEHRKKLSLAKLGNKNALGHKVSEIVKGKLRKSSAGNKNCLGRKLSLESRKKMSEAQKGKKRSIEHRMAMSAAMKGDKCYNWKGGITLASKIIRNSVVYKLWREAVFKRDDWTCIFCTAKSGKGKKVVLHADHIKPFVLFPELRFAIDNGRTLCEDCHRKTETFGIKALNYKE